MNYNFELLQFYIYKKVIKKNQRDRILEDCERLKMPVDKYVLVKGICTETAQLPALGEFFNMPYAQMDMFEPDDELLHKFNFKVLKRLKIVPINIDRNGVLLVAVGRPLDFNGISLLATVYTGKMDFVLVPPSQIDRLLDSKAAVISTAAALASLQKAKDDEILEAAQGPDIAALPTNNDVINAPAVQLVDSIIKEAIPFRASDIHIEPYEKVVRVRYRIDGDLSERASFPIESFPSICARIKIMSNMNIAERRIPQDGRISMNISGSEYDFRVSSLPTIYGEKFVIRILDKNSFNFSRADLGFFPEENLIIDKILAQPHGVILLTGPTGCGKSTTLYSFLKELNKPDLNIITVEDPVEYSMHGINQTQVNVKADMTFASALRSILRQDPDVIMIGEIRDEETAQIAIRAAITGHLVFSTLHTNDAPGAVTRLIDMGTSDYLVADALVAVIAQRLVKRLCPVCKKKFVTKQREMDVLKITEPVSIYRPAPNGCQFCNNTGYKGRVGVHEIMFLNEELRESVSKNVDMSTFRDKALEQGMITLWESCRKYVLNGLTSMDELALLATE